MSEPTAPRRDVGGMVVSASLILLGAAMIWDTTTMVDSDSYVFPRAIIGFMTILCLGQIAWAMIRPVPQSDEGGGAVARRVALVAIMLGGTLAMPVLGFLLAGVIVFAAVLMVAMYDPWTRFRLIVYPLVGLAVSVGFYVLFRNVLNVPFPEGTLFG